MIVELSDHLSRWFFVLFVGDFDNEEYRMGVFINVMFLPIIYH